VYVRPKPSSRILDIGCGTGTILSYLPDVEYLGFDIHQKYIDSAIRKYGERGTFFCKRLTRNVIEDPSGYDIVLAKGVLHHLTDDEALELFEVAHSTLKQDGRLVTIDGCYCEKQSVIARFLLSMDRGKFVRNKEKYCLLASKYFSNLKITIRDDLLRVPYTHIIMECEK
jgi:cyclopropane fatty-acyl-phospholipid synthase-like methyltransferase